MRKNTFLKTALRQPVRSLILALLIAVSAFSFVARFVEHRVITEEITRIEQHFRSIGLLRHPEFIPPNPIFGQIDPMVDQWGNVHPERDVNAYPAAEIVAQSPHVLFEDRRQHVQGELPEGMSNTNVNTRGGPWAARTHYVYFYGVLDRIAPAGQTPEGERLGLHVYVDYVVAGYPEHILAGQTIRMSYLLTDSTDNPFDSLESGNRYFFKAEYTWTSLLTPAPNVGDVGMFEILPFNSGELWYIPVPESGRVDLTEPTLAHLANEIEIHIINMRTMHITATADMSAMPSFQPESDTFVLDDGRLLDYDDYLSANPVAVVGRGFAAYHGLELGDTITLTLRDIQTHAIPMDYHDWRERPTYEIELTIVGTHCVAQPWWSWRSILTHTNVQMFVPKSILPHEFSSGATEFWPSDYSFVLVSPRNQSEFLSETRPALNALGFEVLIFEHAAEEFFASADPIVQSVTVNLLVFTLVSLIALFLAVFIYFHQNRRNFAVLRALGMPTKETLRKQICAAALFWVPAVIIGSVSAWNFALSEAENTLTSLIEVDGYVDVDLLISLPFHLLVVLCAIIAVAALLLVLIGGMRTARRPVLELLQGKRVKRR